MINPRMFSLTALAMAAVVVLSGCAAANDTSQTPAPNSTSDAAFNDADVMFAQMMIPHHEQAIEMSDVILSKDGIDERVTDLATQIKDAQGPEIEQLNEWLDSWGAGEAADGHSGMDGMMSDDDMQTLENATGTDAATEFLEQMIVHHEGAIEMAEIEISDGENAGAVEMAETIASSQTDEISTMKNLLGSL